MLVRRVAAVFAADVVGYSSRMAQDEGETLRLLASLKRDILYPAFERWNGRLFKEMGDGVLVEFASVVDAVECAYVIQTGIAAAAERDGQSALRMRIGIHFGEVVAEGDDLFGDTVNMAARVEAAADVDGIWMSETARHLLGNRVKLPIVPKGPRQLKGFAEPVPLYAVDPTGGAATAPAGPAAKPRTRRLAVGLVGLAVVALAAVAATVFLGTDRQTTLEVDAALPDGLRHGQVFQDCDTCPSMVAVGGGDLLMGAPAEGIASRDYPPDQGPQRLVSIPPFAVGRFEVTRAEFLAFLNDTDHRIPSGCRTWEDGSSAVRDDRSFFAPGFEQADDHPAVCISWHDAKAYTDWVSRETGRNYRLLSEAEWEFMARAGNDTRFSFGEDADALCRSDNIGDATARSRWPTWETALCSDGRVFTGPVGSYEANPLGVFDVYGNVREWVEDCWHSTFDGAPTSAAPWVYDECDLRVVRGGSWDSRPSVLSSSFRGRLPEDHRDFLYGFRLARDL